MKLFRRQHRTVKDLAMETHTFRVRAAEGVAIIALCLLVLVGRYAWLQLIRHDELTARSEQNRIKLRPLAPSRGLIYDRRGVLLAENVPQFRLEVIPEQVENIDDTIAGLAQVVRLDQEDIDSFKELRKAMRRFQSIPLRFHLSEAEVARLSVDRHRFKGVEVVPYQTRFYPIGAPLAHTIGYVGRIGTEDRERLNDSRYSATTHIGKTGIERQYEAQLLGDVGYEQVEANAEGRSLRTLGHVPPKPGSNLWLSIDSQLQLAAIEAFDNRPGAAVAIDPSNGEVLAMVSLPSFDPNLFVDGISRKNYADLTNNPYRPLFNRAVLGGYEPGSTIKPFIGLAGLELGLRTPNEGIRSTGEFRLPGQDQAYRDWLRGGHGVVDLKEALAQSVNTYFYQLAVDLGIDRVSSYTGQFGFGQPTGIDLTGEAEGVLPSREWKQARFGKAWYPGETVISGIGQGYWVTTPLQLANALATLSAQGQRHKPRLLMALQQDFTAAPKPLPIESLPPVPVRDPANWQAVREGMVAVMHGPTGTSRAHGAGAAFLIAGKSGTAQRVRASRVQQLGENAIPEHLRNQALFVAYAPAEAPKIAVALVVEHGLSGSRAAAPVARKIIDAYLGSGRAPESTVVIEEAAEPDDTPDGDMAAERIP